MFRRAGIAHLTAASGANLALVSALDLPMSRSRRWLGEILLIILYLAYWRITGGSGSLWRATFFASLVVLGRLSGRIVPVWFGLTFVVLWSVFGSSHYSRTIGFWLSVAASSGLIFSRIIPSGENRSRLLPRWRRMFQQVAHVFITSAVITVTVAPFIRVLFGEWALEGAFSTPFASLFVLPLQLLGLLAFGSERLLKQVLVYIQLCLTSLFSFFIDFLTRYVRFSQTPLFAFFSFALFFAVLAKFVRVFFHHLQKWRGSKWLNQFRTV